MGIDDGELFRVVETFPQKRNGEHTGKTDAVVYGPYRALSAARAARSREGRRPISAGSVFTIERAPVSWSVVEQKEQSK